MSLLLSFIRAHWVDAVLAIILGSFIVSGYRRGLIQTLGQAVGAVAGFWIARQWSGWLSHLLSPFFSSRAGLVHFVAFVIIFLIVDRLAGFVFWLLDKGLKIITILPFLSTIHQLLGALLGAIEGVLLIGASSYLILTLRLDPTLLVFVQHSSIAMFTQTIFYRVLGAFL